MENCLITKLNVSVDNPNIPRLNWYRLEVGTNSVYGPYGIEFDRAPGESTFLYKPVILSGELTMKQTYTASRWKYSFSKSGNGVIEIYGPRLVLVDDTYSTILSDITEIVEYSTGLAFYCSKAQIDLNLITRQAFESFTAIARGNIVDFMGRLNNLNKIKATNSTTIDANELTGNLSELTVPSSLTLFSVNMSAITGDISTLDLTNATNLTTFELKNSPGVTGSVSAFRTLNPQITTVSFSGCNVTT